MVKGLLAHGDPGALWEPVPANEGRVEVHIAALLSSARWRLAAIPGCWLKAHYPDIRKARETRARMLLP